MLYFTAEHPCLQQETEVETYNKASFTICPLKKNDLQNPRPLNSLKLLSKSAGLF